MSCKFTLILFTIFMLTSTKIYSQIDSLEPISKSTSVDTTSKLNHNSPQIAALASAIMPGLGQAYNKKFWKIPIIWGSGMALYAYFDYNNTYFNRYKNASNQMIAGELVLDPEIRRLNKDDINYRKDVYRRNREKAIIYMGILYVANIVDAMVDAHLLDYDISNELTLHWEPSVIQSSPQPFSAQSHALGAKVQLRF